MLQIKQQEIAARRSIASNPVQMDAIRKQVEKRKAAEEAAKAAKKAEKRAKKDAKRAEKAERKVKKHAVSGRQVSCCFPWQLVIMYSNSQQPCGSCMEEQNFVVACTRTQARVIIHSY